MLALAGCASVPMESPEADLEAKQFAPPPEGQAGLYVYRDAALGTALKKDLWINGECLGETGYDVYFHTDVPGDADYVLSTESEFSPNDLELSMASGRNYFVEQVLKLGVFVGGARLELVEPEEGQAAIRELTLAAPGHCSGER